MKTFAYATLALLALSAARVQGDVENNVNADLGTALRLFIDAFQKIMPCGYEPMGLPVMAPFTLPYYEFNVSTDYVKVHGHVANVVISGFNKFRILGGSYNSTSQRFSYDMLYPEIQVLAEEKLKEWISIGGFPVEFEVDGLVNLKVNDLRFVGEFSIVEKPQSANGTLEMLIHEMNFYVGNVISRNWNKKWDIAMNNFMNKWIGEALEMFDAQINPYVKQLYTQYVLPMANEGLAQLNMEQLIEAYLSVASQFDAAGCQLIGNLV